jgi:hemolysin activation/secretion protein
LEVDQLRLTPLVFMEAASVRRNSPLPGEIESQTLSSVGLGLRASYGRQASARVDWGFVTRGLDAAPGAVFNGVGQGDSRLHVSVVWIN